ncbi:hypothetical protein F4677DRAFT_439289 [Hypoxylon crocopeplum]|nr:hypothetical protein F4677DRAFT_439289 [Hypoxylon crocopeplum]
MEVEPDCIFSSDSFEKYADNDRCRVSKERVKDFLDRGFMTQDGVYQRYTETLSEKLNSAYGPSVAGNIRRSFRKLRDPATGYLSPMAFKHLFAERLSGLEVGNSLDAPALLLDILTSHAFYPFSPPYVDSGLPQIDENAFLRAVSLLILAPARRTKSKFRSAIHSMYGGTWGPHRGWYIAVRGKDASDFRRRLFRSLATPDDSNINTRTVTTIPVPRFEWLGFRKDGSDPEDDPTQQFVVVEDETEASIDILDVLSESPPEKDTLTMNPFRESYRLVLPSLPKRTDDLSSLCIRTTKLVALLKLIQQTQRENTEDLVTSVEEVGSDAKVGWEGFETVMSEYSELLADGIANIFHLFTEAEIGNIM